MGMTNTGALKDCPSCGTSMAEAAAACTSCRSSLGRCRGCKAWIVEGTECFDCGGSTAVRIRAAKAPAKAAPAVAFTGSPAVLLVPIALRFAGFLVFLGGAALALAAADARVARLLEEHVVLPKGPWTGFAAAAAGGLLLGAVGGWWLRRARWGGTSMHGKPVVVETNPGRLVWNGVMTVVVLAFTAGLGLPWLYARYRKTFYQGCIATGRSNFTLGFQGSGDEVLGRFLLTLLALPLALATGGFLLAIPAWMWLKWEQSSVLAPDKNGVLRHVEFTGTFGGFLGRFALGWLLTLLTAGLYRPWARAAEWRWADARTRTA